MTNIANFLNEKDRGEYFLTPVLAMAHDDDNEENRMIGVQVDNFSIAKGRSNIYAIAAEQDGACLRKRSL